MKRLVRNTFLFRKSIEKVSKSQYLTWYRYRNNNFGIVTTLVRAEDKKARAEDKKPRS